MLAIFEEALVISEVDLCCVYVLPKFILGGELNGMFTEIMPYRQTQLVLCLVTVPFCSTIISV